ncbi:MAG TPA: peptide-methionine (S)-S-oxide reductase MsrA, partial [Patescibacteria group bacterium]|nr:peptide-methionine (S)-S-oxide reductase MsrA [Patescibacteria group bacterium]
MVGPFEHTEGVTKVISGYTGGTTEKPTSEEVYYGNTGHVEAVQVSYDPTVVSYETLLGIFWRNIDPTDEGGQFADRGSSYRTAIFYHDEEQRTLAEDSKKKLAASGKFNSPVVTEIRKAGKFYPAEDYHQQYYKKHPERYQFYRQGSG